jgi:hypothetical protein
MNELIARWRTAKRDLEQAKENELRLREKILEAYPGDLGTSTIEGEDFKLTITRGVSRTIDPVGLDLVWHELSEFERSCITYTPKLDARMFNTLPSNCLLSRAVIIKPTLPAVAVELK